MENSQTTIYYANSIEELQQYFTREIKGERCSIGIRINAVDTGELVGMLSGGKVKVYNTFINNFFKRR